MGAQGPVNGVTDLKAENCHCGNARKVGHLVVVSFVSNGREEGSLCTKICKYINDRVCDHRQDEG